MTVKEPIRFTTVEPVLGDMMFRRPSVRWVAVMNALLTGETVFVPSMTRSGLETLRGMMAERSTHRLRSRQMKENDENGYLLKLVPR
jgi:hypothetical protein